MVRLKGEGGGKGRIGVQTNCKQMFLMQARDHISLFRQTTEWDPSSLSLKYDEGYEAGCITFGLILRLVILPYMQTLAGPRIGPIFLRSHPRFHSISLRSS